MRVLTMFTGFLFIVAGAYLMANQGLPFLAYEGITFLSIAFIVGVVFIIAGIVECLSYSSFRGDKTEKSWILIDGMTTFVLGALIVLDKISQDQVVLGVFGLWVIITGIRNFVRAWENIEDTSNGFFDHLIVGIINLLCGLYVFFDKSLYNIPTMTMIGMCVLVQGINIIHVGAIIVLKKPNFLKTKQELVDEAAALVKEARMAAEEAIKNVEVAKAELKAVKKMPEEMIDPTVASNPLKAKEDTETDASAN